jgi:hypothetical protein
VPAPRSFDPRPFIARSDWRLARSVPEFPHEWIVESRAGGPDFDAFAALIAEHGEPRSFGKQRFRYLTIEEHVYWLSRSMYGGGRMINRRLADHDHGDGHGYPLPPWVGPRPDSA